MLAQLQVVRSKESIQSLTCGVLALGGVATFSGILAGISTRRSRLERGLSSVLCCIEENIGKPEFDNKSKRCTFMRSPLVTYSQM